MCRLIDSAALRSHLPSRMVFRLPSASVNWIRRRPPGSSLSEATDFRLVFGSISGGQCFQSIIGRPPLGQCVMRRRLAPSATLAACRRDTEPPFACRRCRSQHAGFCLPSSDCQSSRGEIPMAFAASSGFRANDGDASERQTVNAAHESIPLLRSLSPAGPALHADRSSLANSATRQARPHRRRQETPLLRPGCS